MSCCNASARLRAATILAFCVPILCFGQTSKTTGTIQGTVLDQSGAEISGARVHLSNVGTNQRRETTTDATGVFLFRVPVGVYQLTLESPGFGKYQNNAVESSLGGVTFLTARLMPAKVQQQVTVSEQGRQLM